MSPDVGELKISRATLGRTSLIDIFPSAILRVFPGITASFLHAFLNASASSPLKGVVLETFGAGNAPERDGRSFIYCFPFPTVLSG